MSLRSPLYVTLSLIATSSAQTIPFLHHDGDTVISTETASPNSASTPSTSQQLTTQHPTWNIRFDNAGVGGNRVTGDDAGSLDTRVDSEDSRSRESEPSLAPPSCPDTPLAEGTKFIDQSIDVAERSIVAAAELKDHTFALTRLP